MAIKFGWLTDTHLDHLNEEELLDQIEHELIPLCLENDIKVLVITGDISSGKYIQTHINLLVNRLKELGIQVYFVLGNHDFYNSSFEDVNKQLESLRENYLHINPNVIDLGSGTGLTGINGWYDGLHGNWSRCVVMNDWYVIRELHQKYLLSPNELLRECQRLATESAGLLEERIKSSKDFNHIIVATHVPPFPENSLYKGKISDETWLPGFTSQVMGDCLMELAYGYPDVKFTVLCGHSHSDAFYQAVKNLECFTRKATYGAPFWSFKVMELV